MTEDVEFNDELRDRLTRNLQKHAVRTHPRNGRIRAAVSVIVVDSDARIHGTDDSDFDSSSLRDIPGVPDDYPLTGRVDGTAGGAAILITRRTQRLKSHSGQWALPGGRIDPGETALDAAIRECREEIGLRLSVEQLLGQLDDYPTRSGYVITPFVFWGGTGVEPEPNPDEVASVHRIAIRELLRPDSPRFVDIEESDRPVIQIPVGGDLINAPTGAVIYQFRAVAYDGTDQRVDQYEQPVFAWK